MKKLIYGFTALSIALLGFVPAMPTSAAVLTVGNDTTARTIVDTYHNFTIIDTNFPASAEGELTQFDYYAYNTNPFRFILVDGTNEVKWVSDQITPVSSGVGTYTPAAPVYINTSWNVGLYFANTGTIPFAYTGAPAFYEPNNAGLPVVGETLNYQGLSNRVYSFVATGIVGFDADNDGVLNSEDKCPNTVADAFSNYGESSNRWMWDGDSWVKSGKPGTQGTFNPDLAYTYGCSGTQILNAMVVATGLDFDGHYKFGVSKSILEDWNRGTYYIGPTFVETIVVPADSTVAVSSSSTLESGKDYFLKAYGTANAGDGIEFDAQYSYRTPTSTEWTDAVSTYESYGTGLLDLYVGGADVDWGAYNIGHTYQISYAGTGSVLSLLINDAYYPNNDGSLSVDIIEDKWVSLW